jgi:hypothetical protein
MRFGIGLRTVVATVGCVAMALSAAGCADEPERPKVETIPPGTDISPPPEVPTSATPAPALSVNAAAGCANEAQVIEALIFAEPDSPPPPEAKLSGAPVCEKGWAYAGVTAPEADETRVVLRHTGGKWTVLTFGSAPCSEPRVADAPAKVRAAAGC